MQPYIFPYLGYWQLMHAVDTFVFYDDVNYIKKGWINRNRILIQGKEFTFTIPLEKASQNKEINQIGLAWDEKWKLNFLSQLKQAYAKSPNYKVVLALIESLLSKEYESIAELAIESNLAIAEYLNITVNFKVSSKDFAFTKDLSRVKRLAEITKLENSFEYINPSGGQGIYEQADFLKENIQLSFIENELPKYYQGDSDFVVGLSIIDVLMWNSKDEVIEMISNYKLKSNYE